MHYASFYQQDYDSQLSYDAYGYLVNKTSGNLINQDDDEGYSYESTQYRGSSADFYNQVESTITCPYLGKSIYKYEKCPTCQVYRQYNAYCNLYDDGMQSQYNFGFTSTLTSENEYDVYMSCYGTSYNNIYSDYLIIRYAD